MRPQKDTCLIEIQTEELPPGSFSTLLAAFKEAVAAQLKEAHIEFKAIQALGSPRRLALIIEALSAVQSDQTWMRKGPLRTTAYDAQGQPTPALTGFLKACQAEESQLTTVETPKGPVVAIQMTQTGQSITQYLPEIVKVALSRLPVAKWMHWGMYSEPFVRPVHGVVLLYGDTVIPGTVLGCKTGRVTSGHRIHAPDPITLTRPETYIAQLYQAKVMVDIDARRHRIVTQLEAIAQKQGLTPVMPDALLEEVTHLVEWPVALLGSFDPAFLKVPAEALMLAMQTHQRCFPLRGKDHALCPMFILVSNIESTAPDVVIHGNERVVRARLSDARFFYEQDLKRPLEDYLPDLRAVTFHRALGSIGDKVDRLIHLSRYCLAAVSTDPAEQQAVERAALLCKSDLLSRMVGEFPELQGEMGYYYALAQGESNAVASAISAHYYPRFSGDRVPEEQLGQALALADKVDTIVGIFASGEIPSGSKDPFALRRHAIGVLRILTECAWSCDLSDWVAQALLGYAHLQVSDTCHADIVTFFSERMRPLYEEQGISAEMLSAAMAGHRTGFNPLDIARRVEAIQTFMALPEANALVELNKRVYNLLSKQVPVMATFSLDEAYLTEPAEHALYQAVQQKRLAQKAEHSYTSALCGLSELQPQVSAFFENILVMTEEESLRHNRLALLQQVRDLFLSVADVRFLAGVTA